tara:strand:+ start:876 stop:1202 length:327 start_codon:yes stop_codon:yes gene_type:complete
MKKFRQLFEAPGAPASDNKVEKDDEKEVKGYKPRSKGEEDFANAHSVEKAAHPVATDAQFTGDVSKGNPEEHKGGKKHAAGETVVMQGSSKIKESFSSFVEGKEDGND